MHFRVGPFLLAVVFAARLALAEDVLRTGEIEEDEAA